MTTTTLLSLLLAAVLLFFGQRVYWLFVACVGFVAAVELVTRWFTAQPSWIVIVIAVLAGLVGALLAIFFQRLAVALAGFIAGSHGALLLLADFGRPDWERLSVVIFIVAGILAAVLAVALLDWALVILSALIGAALIAQWAVPAPPQHTIVFLVLFVIGAAFQASTLRGRRRAG